MLGAFCIRRNALPKVNKDTIVNMVDNETKVKFINDHKDMIGQYKLSSYFYLLNCHKINTRDYLWFYADVEEIDGWFN